MADQQTTRMIIFHVSEDEFERLCARSHAEGARSVSDYARDALLNELLEDGNAKSSQQREQASISRKPWIIS